MGAPEGNQNARKENRIFGEELRKVMAQGGRDKIRAGIERLVTVAEQGDQQALTFFADRLDGKPAQGVTVSGDESAPLVTRIELVPLSGNGTD